MPPVLSPLLDALIFIGLAWVLWRGLGRAFPIAVMPIVIGMLLAATGWLPREWGVPSWLGDRVGWIGVLLLAFTAGLETRQMGAHGADATTLAPSPLRLVLSAGVALALPFAVGALAAYHLFARLPDWAAPNGNQLASALGIGLCVAVSALPVLIGIVRELGPPHRRLTSVALRLAVIDDAVLWIGLALLLLYTRQGQGGFSWSGLHLLALAIPLAMLLLGPWLGRRALPAWAVWLAMPLYLAAGAWASTRLGLHELLGAYFAGALMPAAWLRAVPVERIGRFALIGLAPLFFGHSGLKIDGNALGWASLQSAGVLLVLAVAAKLAAVMLCPPVRHFSRRDTLAIGALLQCKGLMEIVAATILRDSGLVSEHAFAALVTLAVLSTVLTGPAFRLVVRQRQGRLAGVETRSL